MFFVETYNYLMADFPLTNSFSEMGQMADMRLYVAVPLLFCFMVCE